MSAAGGTTSISFQSQELGESVANPAPATNPRRTLLWHDVRPKWPCLAGSGGVSYPVWTDWEVVAGTMPQGAATKRFRLDIPSYIADAEFRESLRRGAVRTFRFFPTGELVGMQ